jgi:hypothetical protein
VLLAQVLQPLWYWQQVGVLRGLHLHALLQSCVVLLPALQLQPLQLPCWLLLQ